MRGISRLLLGGELEADVLMGAERSTLMRVDIPDAVPGVAISASIVPPLCVVGATQRERQVQIATTSWLEGTEYRVDALDIDDGDVYLRIAGHGDAPELEDLSASLAEKSVDVKSVSLSVINERRITCV